MLIQTTELVQHFSFGSRLFRGRDMDAVFYYEIPNLHPLAVHFPLALLLTAAVMALVWAFRGTKFWRDTTLLLLVLGSMGAAFAYFTGDEMKEQSEGVPIVEDLVELHEEMGLFTLLMACLATLAVGGIAAFARPSMEGRQSSAAHESELPARPKSTSRHGELLPMPERDPLLLRVLAACLVLAAAALVAWTAHVGATMTWGVVAP